MIWAGFLAVLMQCCLAGDLHAVRNRYYDDTSASAIKEMRDVVEDVRHEVRNHEAEIRTFDEKLKNIDVIIDSLRDHISDASQAHKESLKGSAADLAAKITSLEASSKDLASDMRQFKAHANDTTAALAQYKQKIGELEKVVELQNRNIEHLQAAMQSLMSALQGTPEPIGAPAAPSTDRPARAPATSASGRVYVVKSGDSLEKIARHHQTTIQAIKDLNGLTSDRIIVGKKLQLPDSP